MEIEHYLVWENTRMDIFIMENGKIMLEMDGVYLKTKKIVIDMQANGDKIENGGMDAKLL